MLREVPVFGALAPSLLLYFLIAIPLFLALDKVITYFGIYRLVWHPALVRLVLFVCLLSTLVFSTGQ